MKHLLFCFCLFTGSFVVISAQESLPTVLLSSSFQLDSCAQRGQKNIDNLVENYIKGMENRYKNVFSPVSFRLMGFIVWNNLYLSRCIEKDVADSKIKGIVNEVKNIPCEAVFIFLFRNGLTAPFNAGKILHTTEEIEAMLKRIDNATLQTENSAELLTNGNVQGSVQQSVADEQNVVMSSYNQQESSFDFLSSAKVELLMTHIKTILVLAQKTKAEKLCALLKEIDYFSNKYPFIEDAFSVDIEKLRDSSKCY
jgi:hypothetical protein